MAGWNPGEPDKTLRTGATGADYTKNNLDHLHGICDVILTNEVAGATLVGFNHDNASNVAVRGLGWKTITAAHTAVNGANLLVDTATTGAVTVTLPATPAVGDRVTIVDSKSNFAVANCIVDRTTPILIDSVDADLTLSGTNTRVDLVYSGAIRGWLTSNYYCFGVFTPVLACDVPGDLAISAYETQTGHYTRVGRVVFYTITIEIEALAFTHTTASGAVQITGLPFTPLTGLYHTSSFMYEGITKANYTQFTPYTYSAFPIIRFMCCGSGQLQANLLITEMPTGGKITLILCGYYLS